MRTTLACLLTSMFLSVGACSSSSTGSGGDPPGSAPGQGAGAGECFDDCTAPKGAGSPTPQKPTTPSTPAGDPSENVDPTCMLGQPDQATEVLVPKWAPLPQTVPADCLVGFEVNNLEAQTYASASAAGSRAITLEIDIATYTAADHVRIFATSTTGVQTVLVDTCRLRTATYSDPTNGTSRPPEDSIRDFRAQLPSGTKTITVDNTGATTPTYVRVLGLCDFPLAVPTGAHFRKLTSR